MDSRQVISRFEGERQALAVMDHPNIARVFDAGTAKQSVGRVPDGHRPAPPDRLRRGGRSFGPPRHRHLG
jgi:hypothetical protein